MTRNGRAVGASGVLINLHSLRASFVLSFLQPFSAEQLASAKHTSELGLDLDASTESETEGSEPVHLSIDHQHMGLGGDVGWLPSVHEPFKVEPRVFRYSYTLAPLRKRA